MKPLSLDPDGYEGTYKLVGVRCSLDFVNTLAWAGTGREHDWLSSSENLLTWIRSALELPLGTDVEALRTDAQVMPSARHVRSLLAAVLRPLARGERPGRPVVEGLNDRLVGAIAARVLDPGTLEWTWRGQKPWPLVEAILVNDAADLLAEADHRRLRHCPSCEWLFYDTTRNGRRRWCDMADCGSRDKAKRYYHRHKS